MLKLKKKKGGEKFSICLREVALRNYLSNSELLHKIVLLT